MAKLQKKCKCANKQTCEHPWYDRVQVGGRRRWICLDTDSKGAANRIADKERGDRALEKHGLPVERGTVVRLLQTLVDDYLVYAREDHPTTADTKDAKVLPTLVKAIGNIDIRVVTKDHIDKWRLARRKVKS